MIYKFRIISDEDQLFNRVIEIAENHTFLSFHKAIIKACDYKESEMASFFVSNDDWDKGQEFTLFDMGDDAANTIPMQSAKLSDYVDEIEDKLIYQFDFFGDRNFYCTLVDIFIADTKKKFPICSQSIGNPPVQKMDESSEEFNDLFNETGLNDDDLLFNNFDGDDELGGDDFGSNEDEFGGSYNDGNYNDDNY